MPGVWVFPGGVIEPGEGPECAARELEEETGIALGDDAELRAWARWITPEVVPMRFPTLSSSASPPRIRAPPWPDGREVDDAGWLSPRGALEAHRAGELELVFPTIRTLAEYAAAVQRRRRGDRGRPRPRGRADSAARPAPASTTASCCRATTKPRTQRRTRVV